MAMSNPASNLVSDEQIHSLLGTLGVEVENAHTQDMLTGYVRRWLATLQVETTALHTSMRGLTVDEQRQLIEDLWEASDGCANCAVKFRKLRLAHPVQVKTSGDSHE